MGPFAGVEHMSQSSWFGLGFKNSRQKSMGASENHVKFSHFPVGGGHSDMKVMYIAYWKTKVGGIWCKISFKKMGHSMWAPNKWGLFWHGLPNMRVIQCAKNAISRQNLQILC